MSFTPLGSRRAWPVWLVLLLLGACTPGRPFALGAPTDDLRIPWVPGSYRLRGTLEYRDDSPTAPRTRNIPVVAQIEVDDEGPVGMRTAEGPCTLRPRREVQEAPRYDCYGTVFTVFRSQRMRVSAAADVTESILGPQRCVQYGPDSRGNWVCLRYERALDSRMRTVRTELKIDGPIR